MEEEIDSFAFHDGTVASKGERVDAEERQIVAVPDQCLEFRDDPRALGSRLFDLQHFAFEQLVVN